MEFTDLYKQTNQSTKPSPNSAYIASIVLHRIIIRDAESLQIVTIFTVTQPMQKKNNHSCRD